VAAANTYGVTAATLQAYVADLTFTAGSSPSSAGIVTVIEMEADSLRGLADDRGIVTDGLTSASNSYGVLKLILTLFVLSRVMSGRDRDRSEYYAKEAAFNFRRLMEAPQSVDTTAQATAVESIEDYRDRMGLGTSAEQLTVAGRIIAGGSL
jgi:hypothetical protein